MAGVIGGSGVLTVGKVKASTVDANNINVGQVDADLVNVAQKLEVASALLADHPVFNNLTINDTVNILNKLIAKDAEVTGTLTSQNSSHTHTEFVHNHTTFNHIDIGNFELTDASGAFVINKETKDASGNVLSSTRLLELTE